MSIADWAAVGAAVATSVAAIAAWRASSIAARTYRASKEPQLRFQPIKRIPAGTLDFHIQNVGGGPAEQVILYVVAEPNLWAIPIPPSGFLLAGEGATFATTTRMTSDVDEQMRAVVACLDSAQQWHIWSRDGRHERITDRRWRRRTRGANEMFERMYGDLDRSALDAQSWALTHRD